MTVISAKLEEEEEEEEEKEAKERTNINKASNSALGALTKNTETIMQKIGTNNDTKLNA